MQANLILVLMIGLAVLVVGIVLTVLFTWLGSRGQFLFIDNIVRNRGAVVAPWSEYREEGNSAFWFRFIFNLAVWAAFLIVIIGGILIALADIRTQTFGPAAATGLIIGISGFVVVAIVSGVVNLFLNDFVVPIMYRRRIRVMGAWRVFRDSMLTGHIGTFVLYVLFKIRAEYRGRSLHGAAHLLHPVHRGYPLPRHTRPDVASACVPAFVLAALHGAVWS